MKFLKLKHIIILGLLATSTITPSLHGMSPSSTPTAASSSEQTIALLQGTNGNSTENKNILMFNNVFKSCSESTSDSPTLETLRSMCQPDLFPIVVDYLKATYTAYDNQINDFDGNADAIATLRQTPEIFDTTVTTLTRQLEQQFLEHQPILMPDGQFAPNIQILLGLFATIDKLDIPELYAALEQVMDNLAQRLTQESPQNIIQLIKHRQNNKAQGIIHDYEYQLNTILSKHITHHIPPHLERTLSDPNGINKVAISSDNRFIVTGSDDHTAKIWDISNGNLLRTLGGPNGHTTVVTSVAISHDNRFIVTRSIDHTAKIWDISNGNLLHTLNDVRASAISPDNCFIVTGSWDGTAKVWDATTGHLRFTLGRPNGHTDPVTSIVISPDNRLIVTRSDDLTAKIWDASNGNLRFTLGNRNDHYNTVVSIVISPDNRFIVTGGNHTAKIWDISNGNLLRTLGGPNGHTNTVNQVAISPDNRFIVTSAYDDTVKIWDASTGNHLHTLNGHFDYVSSIAISPNSRFIVVNGSIDRTAKVWDSTTGQLRFTLGGHTQLITGVAFSTDNCLLVAVSHDPAANVHSAKIWRLDNEISLNDALMLTLVKDNISTMHREEALRYAQECFKHHYLPTAATTTTTPPTGGSSSSTTTTILTPGTTTGKNNGSFTSKNSK